MKTPTRTAPCPLCGVAVTRPVGSKGPQKVKMTVHVLPGTADEIKRRGRPGAVLDSVFTPPPIVTGDVQKSGVVFASTQRPRQHRVSLSTIKAIKNRTSWK